MMAEKQKTPPGIWEGQVFHFFFLFVGLNHVLKNWSLMNEPFPVAYWTGIAFPIAHQLFVWLAWRLELRSQVVSKTIGFQAYLVVFFVLFAGRFFSLFALAWLDRGSLSLELVWRVVLLVILLVPGLYAAYSVNRYFGFVRAAGADHFDLKYRKMPLVREGIYRYTKNGMYLFVFLLFWSIAVAFDSSAALVVAAFSQLYIWAHYFWVEKPDMRYLYGNENA